MNRIKLLWQSALTGALIVVCICMSGCGKKTAEFVEADSILTEKNEVPSIEETQTVVLDDVPSQEICIYVCGAVVSPGVYTLEAGSRVYDAFIQAGGLTEDAATDYWNQARILQDGEMIYVPTKTEVKELNLMPQTQENQQNTNTSNGKININTADKETLMTIPGIGETRADSIIAYRNQNGRFKNIEAIMEVSGIKEALYEKIKDYIITD